MVVMVTRQDELEGANDAKYARENPDKELRTVCTPVPPSPPGVQEVEAEDGNPRPGLVARPCFKTKQK